MFEVNQVAQAYGRGGSSTGGAEAVAAPAQPSEGMRVLLSTFENLNAGADKISAMSHALTSSGSDPTPGQLLQVTMEAHKFLFKAELTSNVANRTDRKRVVKGKSVSVRVDLGGRRIIKIKKQKIN